MGKTMATGFFMGIPMMNVPTAKNARVDHYGAGTYVTYVEDTTKEDYEDYLKTRRCPQWQENSIELEAMRKLGREHNDSKYFMDLAETRPPETIANMVIVLIKQADYLLYRQLQRLADDFVR